MLATGRPCAACGGRVRDRGEQGTDQVGALGRAGRAGLVRGRFRQDKVADNALRHLPKRRSKGRREGRHALHALRKARRRACVHHGEDGQGYRFRPARELCIAGA